MKLELRLHHIASAIGPRGETAIFAVSATGNMYQYDPWSREGRPSWELIDGPVIEWPDDMKPIEDDDVIYTGRKL